MSLWSTSQGWHHVLYFARTWFHERNREGLGLLLDEGLLRMNYLTRRKEAGTTTGRGSV